MMPIISGQYVSYYLYQLARPTGSFLLPKTFDEAEALFQQAQSEYEEGEYQQAARLFIAVAEKLQLEKGQPYWESFATNRMLVYENAAFAWAMCQQLEEARRVLCKVAETDAVCVDTIRQLLTRLP